MEGIKRLIQWDPLGNQQQDDFWALICFPECKLTLDLELDWELDEKLVFSFFFLILIEIRWKTFSTLIFFFEEASMYSISGYEESKASTSDCSTSLSFSLSHLFPTNTFSTSSCPYFLTSESQEGTERNDWCEERSKTMIIPWAPR